MPVLWISQLFSLLAIGGLVDETADKSQRISSSIIPPRGQFFKAAAQCLVLADWERTQPHVVEARFFYTIGKTIAGVDPACDHNEVSSRTRKPSSTLIKLLRLGCYIDVWSD